MESTLGERLAAGERLLANRSHPTPPPELRTRLLAAVDYVLQKVPLPKSKKCQPPNVENVGGKNRQATQIWWLAPFALYDFAMLDVSTGLGLGVMTGGQLLAGHSGLAGELGHVTVVPDGIRCGCGNRGCLETLATDSALVRMLSEKLERTLSLDEAVAVVAARPGDFQHELRNATEYLAIAIAAVINIFNPTTLFVHGTLLVGSEERFARVLERVKQRTLTASLADCTILATRSSKRQAAIAGIMHHLTNAWAPSIR